MKNKKAVLIVAAILVVAGVVAFFVLNKEDSGGTFSNEESSKETLLSGSVKDLISGGKSQKCSYTTDVGSGTMYVTSEGRVRGDFNSIAEGATTNSHVIINGDTSYYWVEGQNTGFKAVSDDEDTETSDSSDSNLTGYSMVDLSNNYSYKCSAWIADSSKFELPSGVTFQSFEEMMGSYGMENLLSE